MLMATLTLYKKDDSITIKEDCTTEQDDVRVTPPLSDNVFFSTKPAIQDLPPFTRYS